MRIKHYFISILTLLILTGHTLIYADDASLMIRNATLITVDPDKPDAFNGYLVVGGDGRISHVGEGDPPTDIIASKTIDMGGQVVAPGFISAHSHIYMSPLRGLGHDQNLYGWFKAWDYYLRHTTAEDNYWLRCTAAWTLFAMASPPLTISPILLLSTHSATILLKVFYRRY